MKPFRKLNPQVLGRHEEGIKLHRKGPMRIPLEVRFWRKVRKTNNHWYFDGHPTKDCHCQIGAYVNGRVTMVYAHRVSMVLHGFDVPDTALVCHSCNTPNCVNPAHLYIGTTRSNSDDVIRVGSQKGEKNGAATLTLEKVKRMKALRKQKVLLKDIAKEIGCTVGTVSRICAGKRWSHLR